MASSHPYYSANAGAPVVVQGTVVNASTQHHSTTGTSLPSSQNWEKGEPQPKRCNDVLFALLFYAHLGVMAWATAVYAPAMYSDIGNYGGNARRRLQEEEEGEDQAQEYNENQDYQLELGAIMFLLGIAGLVGFAMSALALSFMMKFAESLIRVALIGNIILYVLLALMTALGGALPMALIFLVGAGITAWYAYVVWARIPFAASNMKTAITGVRANFGLTFFAYGSIFVALGWSIWWSIAVVSSTYVANGCNANGECESQPNGIVVFLFLVSYFWTAQVIKNVVHVTVAGTIGTWWFAPQEASSCCSPAVRDSFWRSVTYSFGSICFGSLIVAIIQAMKEMLRQARESDDGVLMCCAEFLLSCIESLVEYFNQWAFVYVGLYGYSFMEAGSNVMTLFKSRGWTSIITDTLADTALFMVSMGVGCLTGIVAAIIAGVSGLSMIEAFVIGMVLGFVLSAVLFGVVSSAVNTVIVCYAEAPAEFQANHPQLSEEMRATWRQAWPNEFAY